MVEIPLAAEPVFHLGSFTVTNSILNAWIATAVLVLVSFSIRRLSLVPGRLQSAAEMLVETLLSFFDRVTGNREKSKRFLPLVGALFIFILISNWMGLLPGTGSVGFWEVVKGKKVWVPLLRAATADLNFTLALAVVAVVSSHFIGISTNGFFSHANRFIQLGGIWKALKTLSPLKIMTAMIEFVVGIIEIFSEFAKILSLSLRLFGNVFAGEVLLTVIASLVAFIIPLPFMMLELIVGLIQATVFSMLTLVYLTVLSSAPHGAHHEETHHASRSASWRTQHGERGTLSMEHEATETKGAEASA